MLRQREGMLKLFLTLLGVKFVLAAPPNQYELITDYHDEIGIPEAARIKAAEAAADLDGSRIAGGSLATFGQFPYMGGLIIDLTSGQQSVCGSSLLSHNRALTAAQCWRSRRHEGKRLLVVLGSLRLFSGGRRVETNEVLVHENYDKILLHNDIAVIILPTILFTNSIRPINIAEGNQSYVGDTATAVGFGRTGDSEEDGISRQQQLRFVGLQVISTNECARVYGLNYVTNSTLCVSGSGGRSICGGDHGGPLIFNHQVIGVTSINAATGCEKNRPTGFTRVPSFYSWIRANM